MTASHKLQRMSVTFDDPNLIANAGLLLPGTLAAHLDVRGVIDARVDLSGRTGGANTGIKAMTVISALLAGAEWIDDVDVLRAGASEAVLGHEVRASSRLVGPKLHPGFVSGDAAMRARSSLEHGSSAQGQLVGGSLASMFRLT